MDNSWGAVIVAAGRGTRMGYAESKQFLLLQDKPIFIHTLEVFSRVSRIKEMIVVTGAADVARCEEWIKRFGLGIQVRVTAGGSERQDSVYAGLKELTSDYVLVHDGVRPFVTPELIENCMDAAMEHGAALLAVPVKDTIKQVNEEGIIMSTPDRRSLWSIQTPQAFRLSALLEAHERAKQEKFLGTDDAMLLERLGKQVKVVEGRYTNIKITTPDDLDYAVFMQKRGE
ncbi:2-C-methyl-D-erythritol 4-phosphate cytidylyltransferase [Paenibacillus sp. 453mf]|uniref:2-C-methyl-D-erythritol 4-phosphate cytidylyltransferase n=1 Tax=Paenibacillus sp. 453mf TaxID=1761874 RepID=UPI0008DF9CFC|nr:2-C-methyl-D-erythritol 4-phosphate cytidylyltransferase [Paenibacillus sp. 453mf]SFS95507.1 2-C-methyl-D-erythritol 4-phosphate cytidylyltransferase [Paenibacillus sp. 453mf]